MFHRSSQLVAALFFGLGTCLVVANPPGGYNYLMYSDPLIVRVGGSQAELVVTAKATRRKDTIALSVDGNIVETKPVGRRFMRATFKHMHAGEIIRVVCASLLSVDNTYNHRCRVSHNDQHLGEMDVVKRIYPKRDGTNKE